MVYLPTIEGTGAEISKYAGDHPSERFLLVAVPSAVKPLPLFDQAKWDATMARIESYRDKFPVLPDEAYSTDSLYD